MATGVGFPVVVPGCGCAATSGELVCVAGATAGPGLELPGCCVVEVSGPAGVVVVTCADWCGAVGVIAGGDIADTASDTEDPGSLGASAGGGSAAVCGVVDVAGGVGTIDVTDVVAVVSAGTVGVVVTSAGEVAVVAVAGAGITCETGERGDDAESSAQALIGSARATAPTAAIASGRTRIWMNDPRLPGGSASR